MNRKLRAAHRIMSCVAMTRVAIGVVVFLAPDLVHAWIGRTTSPRPVRLLGRSVAARDLALGAGALWALQFDHRSAARWVQAGAISDLGDAAATILQFGELPPIRRAAVLFSSATAATAALFALTTSKDI